MKRLFLMWLGILSYMVAIAQKDTSLDARVTAFFKANTDMDLKEVLDYIYPKLFTLVTREEMLASMERTFDNENVNIRLDSLRVDTLYPIIQDPAGRFARINYSMNLIMQIKNENIDSAGNGSKDRTIQILASQYGNVKYDKEKDLYIIVAHTAMVAVKDSFATDWCFVNLKKGDQVMDLLLPKEVLEKLNSFN